jgi:hypothetical protein
MPPKATAKADIGKLSCLAFTLESGGYKKQTPFLGSGTTILAAERTG